jgi:hypothetical protein
MSMEVWNPWDKAVEVKNESNVWSYNLDPPYAFIICIRKNDESPGTDIPPLLYLREATHLYN